MTTVKLETLAQNAAQQFGLGILEARVMVSLAAAAVADAAGRPDLGDRMVDTARRIGTAVRP